ncbi:DCD and Cell domain protein [Perilla frutescens var. hirtella]|nr:DCD and Cell domain protein [Perilla frutescens var. frutescens]KAH6800805.1 DCD and Cell domain protein [Perilla frutescens var. hirtella]
MISVPATLIYPAEANASDPENHKNGGLTENKEREKAKCLSGFIFLCNQSTKLECYRYRVFGLPWGKKEVVEEIKPGLKLFLFDFELKLLYGVYEATSAGTLNLEPAAFGGKFPAQVQFNIFKECLPIPESSLRYLIKENYTGTKFKQELSGKQVTKLISSFYPLAASSWQPASQALANVSPPGPMPPSVMENQLKLTGRLPTMEVPHLAEVQYSRIRPLVDTHSVLNVNYLEHGSHRIAAYVENLHPTIDHRSLPVASSYYVGHPQWPLFAEDVVCGVQEPSYSRYKTIESGAVHTQITRYTTMEQRHPHHDGVTISERQYYQQLPLQRGALYQDNASANNSNSTATDQNAYSTNPTATDQYTPSVMQTQHSASYHQLPLQVRQYHDSIVAHGTKPAAPAQHTTSDLQQQVPAAYLPLQKEASHQDNVTAYHSNLIALAQYASSVMQKQVPVPYDESSLRGTQYQDSVVAYNSNLADPAQHIPSVLQPQVQATYLPLQREALYQDNTIPYNCNLTVPYQFTSITQPPVSATDLPLQSEALHRVNVAAYNSNTVAVAQYTPSEGIAPISSYYPYSAADHHPSQ